MGCTAPCDFWCLGLLRRLMQDLSYRTVITSKARYDVKTGVLELTVHEMLTGSVSPSNRLNFWDISMSKLPRLPSDPRRWKGIRASHAGDYEREEWVSCFLFTRGSFSHTETLIEGVYGIQSSSTPKPHDLVSSWMTTVDDWFRCTKGSRNNPTAEVAPSVIGWSVDTNGASHEIGRVCCGDTGNRFHKLFYKDPFLFPHAERGRKVRTVRHHK